MRVALQGPALLYGCGHTQQQHSCRWPVMEFKASEAGEDMRGPRLASSSFCVQRLPRPVMPGEGSSALLQRHVDMPREVSSMKVLIWLLWAL